MTLLKIVVSDSSVLMDLAKADLIEPTLALPYEFMIPDVIFARELLDLGKYTRAKLKGLGFTIGSLEGGDVEYATTYFRQHRTRLSLNDCFAWRLAEVHKGVLMTGDADLRKLADISGVEVHGVLWAIDLMARQGTCRSKRLVKALDLLDGDDCVRLPRASLRALRAKIDGEG